MSDAADYNRRQLLAGRLTWEHVAKAFRAYQEAHDLTPDGMAGPRTRASMEPPTRHCWPLRRVQGCRPAITSGYGLRRGKWHRANDIMLVYRRGLDTGGAPVYKGVYWCPGPFIACEAGQVMRGYPWGITKQDNGTRLWIENEDGIATGYFHCARDLMVDEGDVVVAGQEIAEPADRDFVWPPHVHLERSKVDEYRPIDPQPWLESAIIL